MTPLSHLRHQATQARARAKEALAGFTPDEVTAAVESARAEGLEEGIRVVEEEHRRLRELAEGWVRTLEEASGGTMPDAGDCADDVEAILNEMEGKT